MDSLHEVVRDWILGNFIGAAAIAMAFLLIRPRKTKNK